jgi:hypothetical protein
MRMAKVPTNEMKVASGIHIVPQTTSMNLFKTENSYLGVLASWREVPLSVLAREILLRVLAWVLNYLRRGDTRDYRYE